MRRTSKLVIAGALIQFLSLIAYVAAGQSSLRFPAKELVVGVAIISMMVLFWISADAISKGKLIFLCAVVALLGALSYEIIGYGAFPGLVKDVEVFSSQQLLGFVALTGLLFLSYSVISIVMALVRAKLARRQHRAEESQEK